MFTALNVSCHSISIISYRFWTHIVMAYAFTFWTCYVLLKEYETVASMRFLFLQTEKRRPDQFSVLQSLFIFEYRWSMMHLSRLTD